MRRRVRVHAVRLYPFRTGRQQTGGERGELASRAAGAALRGGNASSCRVLRGARRRRRFTAGRLLRTEPQEACQERAKGISTIINNAEGKEESSCCRRARPREKGENEVKTLDHYGLGQQFWTLKRRPLSSGYEYDTGDESTAEFTIKL